MLAILATILLKIIFAVGIGFLMGLILRVVLLTAKALLTKIRDTLATKVGTRVFAGAVSGLAREVEKEAERNNNIKKAHELLKELEGEGVVTAEIDSNGTVDENTIKIIKAEKIDNKLDQLLQANQGFLIIEE